MLDAAIILGHGEIGRAVGSYLVEHGIMVEFIDPPLQINPNPRDLQGYLPDVMHVCFPFQSQETFLAGILPYLKDSLKLIIIHSTLSVGTTEWLSKFLLYPVVHSPLRGTHPHIMQGILTYCNFVGIPSSRNTHDVVQMICEYYDRIQLNYELLTSSRETELGKLVNTTWYGLQIAFANLIDQICRQQGIQFHDAYTSWMATDQIGRFYEKNEQGRAMASELIPRPVMIPGKMGGHCVMPNIDLLEPLTDKHFITWFRQMHKLYEGLT